MNLIRSRVGAFRTRVTGVVLALAAATMSAPAAGLAAQQAPAPGAARPNIILILADDLGHEVLNSYGGTSYRTPHLDRLAAEGMRFERAHATPLCTPTRVHLMTGKHNFRNYERFGYLNPKERTFANYLHEAGYATAVAGKWQLTGDEKTPHGFGFDEYLLWQLRAPDSWTRYKDPVVTRNGSPTQKLTGRYGPDVFEDFVEDFIERNRDRPFMVYYPMPLTHGPFHPPPGHPDYERLPAQGTNDPKYFPAMVERMDAVIGRLVGKLESLGLRENTLVLFIGDNGTDVDITSRMGDRVVRGDKGGSTDAGTHVPLIASWKGTIAPGQVVDELVDVGDLFPTVLDVAGIATSVRGETDGISLARTLRTGRDHAREWLFRDYHPGKESPGRSPARWAQDTRYKLYSDGRFYDYVADPLERSPLAAASLSDEARRARAALGGVMKRMSAEIAAVRSRDDAPVREWEKGESKEKAKVSDRGKE